MLYVVNAPYRIKGQQNTMSDVVFTPFNSGISVFHPLVTDTCKIKGGCGYFVPAKHGSLQESCLRLRIMSKKMVGCHKTMMKELKGLIYGEGLKQLNRVTKSWPSSIGVSYILKLEENFVNWKFQGHSGSWKGGRKRSSPRWYIVYKAKTRAGQQVKS